MKQKYFLDEDRTQNSPFFHVKSDFRWGHWSNIFFENGHKCHFLPFLGLSTHIAHKTQKMDKMSKYLNFWVVWDKMSLQWPSLKSDFTWIEARFLCQCALEKYFCLIRHCYIFPLNHYIEGPHMYFLRRPNDLDFSEACFGIPRHTGKYPKESFLINCQHLNHIQSDHCVCIYCKGKKYRYGT